MAGGSEKTEGNGGRWHRHRLILWMAGVLFLLLVALLIAASIDETDTRKALLGRLLDWPVLAFAIAMMLFGALGREVLELVRTRNIKVGTFLEVGAKINAVEAETDEMGASLADRIAALEQAVYGAGTAGGAPADASIFASVPRTSASVAGSNAGTPMEPAPPPAPASAGANRPTEAEKSRSDLAMFERLRNSLASSRFEWRSLERLAVENGLTEDEVRRLFRDYGQGIIRLGIGKSGRRIATLIKRN